MEKLVNPSVNILDDGYNVVDIYYHKGKTDALRIHGNYYARVHNTKAKKQNKKQNLKSVNDMKAYIQLSYSEKVGEETQYWTHVFNVLEKMKEIGTLEPAGLLTNYNHYFTQPVVEVKRIISAFSNKDVSLKRSQVNWIVGRHMKDKKDGLYIATSLSETNTGKINGVMVSKVNPDNMLREAETQEINANVIIAMTLAIEYHENKMPSYEIDAKYESQQSDTKYKMYDFIIFDANYFNNFDTQEPIQDEFIGIVLQNYDKFDKETETYKNYYDILFEDELWRLESDSVDKKSKELSNPVRKKQFIAKIKNERKLISKVIKELGLKSDLMRIKTRSTSAKVKAKTKSKTKPKSPAKGTRTSPRKKSTNTSTMKLRSSSAK